MKVDDSKEMADAKDKGEECESKQYDVVEAQGRIEGKEESEDDIADKDKKCKKEPDVVDGSPRNPFLLLIQVVLLLLESKQGDGDGEEEDDQGQACSDGVNVQDEVGGGDGGQLWPK